MRNWIWRDWIIVVLVAVVAGGGILLWRLKPPVVFETTTSVAAVATVAPAPEIESDEDRAELARLRKENARLANRLAEIASMQESQTSSLPADASEAEKFLRRQEEARRLAAEPKPAVFDFDGSLSQEFFDAYGLNPSERKRLRESFRNATVALARVSAGYTRGRYLDADTYELAISPFPAEGGAIYDRLMGDVKDVLGAGRYDAFLQLSADEIERRFGGLGTQKGTLKVRWNGGRKGYDIEEVDTASGGVSMGMTNAAYIEVLDGMYPHLGPLLPAEFRARSTEADFLKRGR